ncbi:hypothetical protein H0H81_005937 [Sphagnurus paluster]|uniref:Uncharacterized protein n=1 Tax=Sphagnurus paluster TaxID=117069 RepID=A0A9P7GKB4_9AGAR|nr:hypothetical protein H0H81_005937 [Sphagnurus paluster]
MACDYNQAEIDQACQCILDVLNDDWPIFYAPHPPKALIVFMALMMTLDEQIPKVLEYHLSANPTHQRLIAQAVNKAKAQAPPPPTPPSPPWRSPPLPPQAHVPQAPRLLHEATPLHQHPSQTAPKPSYAAALGSKAPCPHKAHPPTTLVAPASTKWVVIPNNKSQLRDAAKRLSPHHIVGTINHELHTWAGESIGGVQVANLGDSHILAATWTVGCNLLITAAKTRDDRGLATPTYSTIVGNALFTIPAFSNVGVTVIPYQPATRLQIKGLPTWDPTTNRPIELTSVYQMLNGLGIFEGVELIKNGPAPSDALSWAWDPKTFNAESHPCAVTVRFYNNNGRETGALLKKAFYLLGRWRRFDKWPPPPPPPKKG